MAKQNIPEFIQSIDWELLRKQKSTLVKFQCNNANDAVDGIINLIDGLQDYAVDMLGLSEMLVFGLDVVDKGEIVTKTLWQCPHCKSDNVDFKVWTKANHGNEITDENPMEEEDCWCNDCERHGKLIIQEMAADKEVIGFQVVNNANDIHPDMYGSFCVYNLWQANKMLEKDNDWKLLTIWTGDIEEPTIMFEGNPRP